MRPLAALGAVLTLATALFAPRALADEGKPDQRQAATIAAELQNSLVRVEYDLQFDKSDAPHGAGWSYLCSSCGRYHSQDLEDFIRDERSAERAGFVLDPTHVLTFDAMIHPRFLRGIQVRFGDQIVDAKPSAYGRQQSAMILELARPLRDAKPLQFDASRPGPYAAVTYNQENADWALSVQSVSQGISFQPGVPTAAAERRFTSVPTDCLIVDSQGTPVGMSMNSEIPADDSWKGSPNQWPMISAAEMEQLVDELQQTADRAVLRVSLSFRSPRKTQRDQFDPYEQEPDEGTERNVIGLLADDRTVLVLSELRPQVTARLERIRVHLPDGTVAPARFAGSLRDYGAFVAELEQPVAAPRGFADADIRQFRYQLLPAAEITVQGESRVAYYRHGRIASLARGWNNQVYPHTAAAVMDEYLFEPQGKLLAFPISQRKKVTVEERWDGNEPVLTASQYLAAALDNLSANVDASNIPLSEAEENRIAWMGLELQPLDRELARANNISDITSDGETGGLVTFVYDPSPAAAAGIQVGDILLRLHVTGHPKPMDVSVGDEGYEFEEGFPWDRLDELPEKYYDQIPEPWPTAENSLNRKLTELGRGTAYRAEIYRDGETIFKDLQVEFGPPHYASASKFTSDALGLTVRDLTYEVRRYLQRGVDEPGVVVSKIEPGSKTSVSGIKPYEVITHVNDKPIMTAAEFGAALEGQTDLRLSIKRMNRGRVVKIALDEAEPPEAAEKPAAAPAGN